MYVHAYMHQQHNSQASLLILRHCEKNQYAVVVMTFKISFQLKKKKICINQFRSKIFIKHKRIQSLSLAEFRLPTVKEDNSLKS